MKSGDSIGGIANGVNTITGVVSGLSNNIKNLDNKRATTNDVKNGNFKVDNDFYLSTDINLGFTRSESKSKSHNENAVVTNIQGKDSNSSITYNNVNTVNYDGTQAKNTKFIYNNVENINKTAVELNNYNRSSSKSTGVSAGLSFDEQGKMNVDAVRVSASGSKMNTDETIYQNGSFVNVDEVHNNTKNITLSGFNQEGGTVTGNIENLKIESKQNTSVTKGSSYSGSVGVSPSGTVSGGLSLSKTNGERRYVDTPSSFIVGENSNLSIGKAENTAAIIGTTDNGKIKINEYAGKNLDNIDKMKTVGASVGTSYSKGSNPTLTGVGVNYSNSDLRSTTKNTVVGNVEIGKSSGDEINRDINAIIEITKDDKTNTNVNVEAQTIDYLSNLNKFKEDLELSIVESKATATSIVKKIDNILTNGDDIGQNEKRTLLEIKQSVMEAQNLNQIDIIANTEYSAKDLQDKLGVTIEKFDPNSEDLSLAVKERIEELKELGIKETGSPYSLEAFYDKSTKKIFINKDISDDKLRPAIAREWKIKEDLKNNLGKENSQGKLKSTTAGAIAYREVEKRLKNKNDSLSVKDFDVAIMNENSEVTADLADKDVEDQYFNTLKYVEAMSDGAWKKNPEILKEMRGDKGEIEDFIFRPDFYVKSIHLIYAESKEGKKKIAIADPIVDSLNKNNPDREYYKRIDGIKKEVVIESNPKAKSYLHHFKKSLDEIGNVSLHFLEAGDKFFNLDMKGAVSEGFATVNSLFKPATLGIGFKLGDEAGRVGKGSTQYGTKEEVEGKQEFMRGSVEAVTDIVVTPIVMKTVGAGISKGKEIYTNYKYNSYRSSELFLPNEYYDGKKLPSQVMPGIKYLPKYDETGNIKQIKMYDDYGRQIGWVDYTNHGYSSNHTIPHWHEVRYDEQYIKGIIIDHRTDINTPLGNK